MKTKKIFLVIAASSLCIIFSIFIFLFKAHNKLVPFYAAIDGKILIEGPVFYMDGYEVIEKPEHFNRNIETGDKDLLLYDKEFVYLYIKIKKFNVKTGDKVKKNSLLGYVEKEQEIYPAIFKVCNENCDPE